MTCRVRVMTSAVVAPWQARCIEGLASTPGIVLVPDVGEESCDVVVDLTMSERRVTIPGTEVWRFGFGPDLSPDLARVVLLDYVRGPGSTRVALVREPGRSVLREGRLESVSWWHPSDLDRALASAAGWPAEAARHRIEASAADPGSTVPDAGIEVNEGSPGRQAGIGHIPTSVLRVAAIGRRMVGVSKSFTRHDGWNVGIVDASIGSTLRAGLEGRIVWLPARPGHYAADPFALERDGVLHIFYEDFDWAHGTGRIEMIALAPDGSFSEPEVVLDPGFHVSYPFIIEDGGEVYMLPEASASGELVLYRMVSVPGRFEPIATLLSDLPAVDASIVRHGDRWWMFACRADRGVNHDLFIWHAPDILGPWDAHAGNPVKTDARSARPGGTPFVVDGALYRPSQDDSRIYGGGLVINRIDTLTPTAFEERPVRALRPSPGTPYPHGLHTLSAAGRRTLIDGNIRRFVPDAARSRARAIASRRRAGLDA